MSDNNIRAFTSIPKVRFCHWWTPAEIDDFCKEAENQGERVMLTIYSYKKEILAEKNADETVTEWEEDRITGGLGYQIHSSKDIFQTNNEDVKMLRNKEELR